MQANHCAAEAAGVAGGELVGGNLAYDGPFGGASGTEGETEGTAVREDTHIELGVGARL